MPESAIVRLQGFLARHGLTLAACPTDTGLESRDAIDILISNDAVERRLTVFDEYADAAPNDSLLLAVLVAYEFGEIADAGDAASWARAHGLAPEERVESIYRRNLATLDQVRKAIGEWPDEIPALDWQLNSGAAQALRRRAGRV